MNADFAVQQINRLDLDTGIGLLDLGQARVRGAIGQHKSVGVEVVIVGLVAKIAAVSPEILTVGSLLSYALVDPIPDETAVCPRL